MRNWTIGRKLVVGFAAVLTITVALGAVAFWSGSQISDKSETLANEVAPVAVHASEVCSNALEGVFVGRGYFLSKDQEDADRAKALLAQAVDEMKNIHELAQRRGLDDLARDSGEAGELGQKYRAKLADYFGLFKSFNEEAGRMGALGAAISGGIDEFNKGQQARLEAMLNAQQRDQAQLKARMKVIEQLPEMTSDLTAARVATALYINTRKKSDYDKAIASMQDLQRLVAQTASNVAEAQQRKLLDQAATAIDGYLDGLGGMDRLNAQMLENDRVRTPMYVRLLQVARQELSKANQQVKASSQDTVAAAAQNNTFMTVGIVAALAIGTVLVVLITRSITRTLKQIIVSLSEGAEKTAAASEQVSSSSQTLAEGASEAAASIEETTSSVEEMTSMTKQNADNASQADGLMKQAGEVVTRGKDSMQRLSQAIGQIRTSADETAKIVKTIDEIAFQTNLLALNAAVEAARAGEAGKGFAVVAEEVRNLAQRSAEAARTTADLIHESVDNAENGVTISGDASQAFEEVIDSSEKVAQLITEISAASSEQADGIEQISLAIGQMDQVTQSNAANAEESASAAEELSAQAEELNVTVAALSALVEKRAGNGPARQSFKAEPSRSHQGPRSASQAPHKPSQSEQPKPQSPQSQEQEEALSEF
jgi:methyl-accepting chemotaxis protein